MRGSYAIRKRVELNLGLHQPCLSSPVKTQVNTLIGLPGALGAVGGSDCWGGRLDCFAFQKGWDFGLIRVIYAIVVKLVNC